MVFHRSRLYPLPHSEQQRFWPIGKDVCVYSIKVCHASSGSIAMIYRMSAFVSKSAAQSHELWPLLVRLSFYMISYALNLLWFA